MQYKNVDRAAAEAALKDEKKDETKNSKERSSRRATERGATPPRSLGSLNTGGVVVFIRET